MAKVWELHAHLPHTRQELFVCGLDGEGLLHTHVSDRKETSKTLKADLKFGFTSDDHRIQITVRWVTVYHWGWQGGDRAWRIAARDLKCCIRSFSCWSWSNMTPRVYSFRSSGSLLQTLTQQPPTQYSTNISLLLFFFFFFWVSWKLHIVHLIY